MSFQVGDSVYFTLRNGKEIKGTLDRFDEEFAVVVDDRNREYLTFQSELSSFYDGPEDDPRDQEW